MLDTPSVEDRVSFIRPEDAAHQSRVVRANHFGVNAISMLRRAHDARFATRYFRGNGIDVGGGLDSLVLCKEFFPQIGHLFVYEHEHGDAQALANLQAWVADGRLKVKEDVIDGLASAPAALIGLLAGENRGKRMIRVA